MNELAWERSTAAPPARVGYAEGRRLAGLRRIKLACALLLGICFWYAVPYQFPLRLDPNPVVAAASEADAFQGNLSRQIAMPLILLVCAFGLYRLPRQAALLRSRLSLCVVAYLSWCVVSVMWSADPVLTRKRLVVFLIDALVAYSLARLITLRELALFGFVSTGAVAAIALLAHLGVLQDFRPWDPDFRFMGVMTANYQAMNLFVCLACGLILLLAQPRWAKWLVPLLMVFAMLLFLTRARVGTLLFLAIALGLSRRFLREALRPQGRALLLTLVAAVGLPSLIFVGGRSGTEALTTAFMMGRHDTENTASLSNRAPLWSELLDSVRQEPWLGAGFAAFWSPERVERVSLDQGWVVPHAHNSYLDETLSLGLVGGALYIALLAGACGVAWKRYRRRPEIFNLLPILLLGWLAGLGLTESMPLSPYLPTLLAYSCIARMCMQEPASARAVSIRSGERFWRGKTRDLRQSTPGPIPT